MITTHIEKHFFRWTDPYPLTLDYRVVYSQRKTVALSVERDTSVVVRAPVGTPAAKIQQAIETKKLWLFEKTGNKKKYPPKRQQKEFVSGEAILYLGRNYRLEVTDSAEPGIQFRAGFSLARQHQAETAKLFRQWYVDRAQERIPARTEYFARALGVDFKRVLISDLKVRWGSCTPNSNLNFNWRIIKAPSVVIDYLIVHELAHLIESNHTPRFWNIVSVQVPRAEWAKQWLLENGDLLEIDF